MTVGTPGRVAPVAGLPMYDLPELVKQTDALWRFVEGTLTQAGFEAPGQLTRGGDPRELWRDPGLILSQTCGFPLVTEFAGTLDVLATPAYRAEGCDGPRYSSRIVVREGSGFDLDRSDGGILALNSFTSQSGWNALAATLADRGRGGSVFRAALVTGAHVDSIRAVREGRADLAAIDAVTWALLARHRPTATAGLTTVAWTVTSPGLPFIVRRSLDPAVRAALVDALETFSGDEATRPVRDALLIEGFVRLGIDAYAEIEAQRRRAAAIERPPLFS